MICGSEHVSQRCHDVNWLPTRAGLLTFSTSSSKAPLTPVPCLALASTKMAFLLCANACPSSSVTVVLAVRTGADTGVGRDGIGGFDGVGVQVRNVFFEWVPPRLVDVYVTEHGRWTVEDISRHSARLGGEQERLFKHL